MSISCRDQAEVDLYWEKLIGQRGKEIACSWLKDHVAKIEEAARG